MKITKQQFRRYLAVQRSGLTNMFDIKAVMMLSGLDKEECLEIMRNYGKLKEEYGGQNEN